MPKIYENESVLHDWVQKLTFQQQALLLTAMRGPDENNKYSSAKAIVRFLRSVVIKPAGDWDGSNDNDFMWGDYEQFNVHADNFWEDHDEYPHHFIMHLLHCAEVIAYKHDKLSVCFYWKRFYLAGCKAFHMNPEKEEQMDSRLNDFGCGFHNK